MTRYALVQASGLSVTQVYRLARPDGRFRRLDDDVLDRLCTALNVQPGELLEWIPGGQAQRRRRQTRRET